jgi:hypothetical protein
LRRGKFRQTRCGLGSAENYHAADTQLKAADPDFARADSDLEDAELERSARESRSSVVLQAQLKTESWNAETVLTGGRRMPQTPYKVYI